MTASVGAGFAMSWDCSRNRIRVLSVIALVSVRPAQYLFHLDDPPCSRRARFKRSWLSREVVAFSVYAGAAGGLPAISSRRCVGSTACCRFARVPALMFTALSVWSRDTSVRIYRIAGAPPGRARAPRLGLFSVVW